MLYVAKLHAYAVLHVCECKDKARQSKTSVFNFCGSMLPGVADFNAKNNKKNLHDCNGYMNNDELRNTLKFSQLSRYANKQATTKLPRYTQSVAWLHSVHLLCTRQSVNGANRDHYTNK